LLEPVLSNADLEAAVRAAIGAHGAWKLKLKTAVNTGRSEATPATVGRDDQCEFGKWLHGQGIDEETRAGMPYQVVRRLHAEFHQCAGRVLALGLDGKRVEAGNLLEGEYTARSEKLVTALAKWRGELQTAA
jgi:hypothetical protein